MPYILESNIGSYTSNAAVALSRAPRRRARCNARREVMPYKRERGEGHEAAWRDSLAALLLKSPQNWFSIRRRRVFYRQRIPCLSVYMAGAALPPRHLPWTHRGRDSSISLCRPRFSPIGSNFPWSIVFSLLRDRFRRNTRAIRATALQQIGEGFRHWWENRSQQQSLGLFHCWSSS